MVKTRSSWIWEYIRQVKEKGIAKCNLCDKSFIYRTNKPIKYHLYHNHELYNDKEIAKWKNDTNDLIWRYFSKQDGYIACCKNCNKLLKHGYNITNLINHLYSVHQDIIQAKRGIIERTSLSQSFIFKDWRVLCKQQGCSYSTTVFKKIDVLKSHLERHIINRYSGCEERTEDNKAERMIQQSVEKTNCTGPSSHHDNTQKQSLENQESLQSYQRYGQQESKSHKIWKPYL